MLFKTISPSLKTYPFSAVASLNLKLNSIQAEYRFCKGKSFSVAPAMTSSTDGLDPPATDLNSLVLFWMPGVVVPLHIKFFQTSDVVSTNQAKSPFILLNNKILHKQLVVKHPHFMTNFRFHEHDMLRIKLPIFETKLQFKLLLLWTAKQILLLSSNAKFFNILFPLSYCESFSFCLHFQSQHWHNHKQHHHHKSSQWCQANQLNSLLTNYTSQAKIKSNSSQFAWRTACQVLTNFSCNFTQQSLCKPRIWITKKNFTPQRALSGLYRNNHKWREYLYSFRGLWFPGH